MAQGSLPYAPPHRWHCCIAARGTLRSHSPALDGTVLKGWLTMHAYSTNVYTEKKKGLPLNLSKKLNGLIASPPGKGQPGCNFSSFLSSPQNRPAPGARGWMWLGGLEHLSWWKQSNGCVCTPELGDGSCVCAHMRESQF